MSSPPSTGEPYISVVIPTRNRGAQVVGSVESILAITNQPFELIVVDQSTNDETRQALEPFQNDPRFRYHATNTKGTGRSRNIGLNLARGELVLYADDDCIVPANWIDCLQAVFEEYPKAAVVFCDVVAGEHDHTKGFIPEFRIRKTRVMKNSPGFLAGIGIGAGMAVRRSAVLSFGGFDNCMGPGSICPSTEDHDIAMRAVFNGWWVVFTPTPSVVHLGYRSYEEGVHLTKRDFTAIGAGFIKIARCGKIGALCYLFSKSCAVPMLESLWNLLRLKRAGFRRILFFVHGVLLGARLPLDRKLMVYVLEDAE